MLLKGKANMATGINGPQFKKVFITTGEQLQ